MSWVISGHLRISALLSKADMCGATTDARYGPIADIVNLPLLALDNSLAPRTSFRRRSHFRNIADAASSGPFLDQGQQLERRS
jgi:hypothetical protein